MIKNKLSIFLYLICFSFFLLPIFSADESIADANKTVKARQENFKAIKNSMKSLGKALKSGAPSESMKKDAENFKKRFAKIVGFFSDESQKATVESDADSKIWKEKDKFVTKVKQIQKSADQLLKAIDNGNKKQIVGAVKQIGADCKSCHRSYRL